VDVELREDVLHVVADRQAELGRGQKSVSSFRASEDCSHTGKELRRVHGLDEVVVAADQQSGCAIEGLASRAWRRR
jgi:hypothetical protein